MNPLSILHVASPAPVGGLERVLHGLALGHHRRGHRVGVVALVGSRAASLPFCEGLEAGGVDVHALEVRTSSVFRERSFVHDACRRLRPDVVHTHGYRPDIVDSGVARRLGIPVCTTEHGMSKMGGRTALWEWLQIRSFRRFDAVVAVSRPIAEALERWGVSPERIHLVPNAWAGDPHFLPREEARRALGLPAEGLVLGFVGRLIQAKGGDVLLRALALLPDLAVDAVVIGEGPERAALEALARELSLSDRVRFLGAHPDAAPLFRAFDAFVLSSRTEGTPIVLFEAMAAGIPVVGTRVGGVPDVVTDREVLLVAPEEPRALAVALRTVLCDAAGARERATAARKRLSEAYAVEPWLDRYEAVYRSLLRSPAAS